MEYKINSKQKEHSCKKLIIIKEETRNILTKSEETQLTSLLNQKHIDETPVYHINNLKNNKIFLSNYKIINLVYQLQEATYPIKIKKILYKILLFI